MNVYFSLSTIYSCLSRFLPISIYAYHYFHKSDAFATPKSDFQFLLLFGWLLAGFLQFFFTKILVQKKQKLNTKSLSKAENQKKNLYCEILNKSTAEIKVPQSNGGFLCFMTSILKSGNHKWIPYNIFALAFT